MGGELQETRSAGPQVGASNDADTDGEPAGGIYTQIRGGGNQAMVQLEAEAGAAEAPDSGDADAGSGGIDGALVEWSGDVLGEGPHGATILADWSSVAAPEGMLSLCQAWTFQTAADFTSLYATADGCVASMGGLEGLRQLGEQLRIWGHAMADVPDAVGVGNRLSLGLTWMSSGAAALAADASKIDGDTYAAGATLGALATSADAWVEALCENANAAVNAMEGRYILRLSGLEPILAREGEDIPALRQVGERVGEVMDKLSSAWDAAQRNLAAQKTANENNRIAFAISGLVSGTEGAVDGDRLLAAQRAVGKALGSYERWLTNTDLGLALEDVKFPLEYASEAADAVQAALDAVETWSDDLMGSAETTTGVLTFVRNASIAVLLGAPAFAVTPMVGAALGSKFAAGVLLGSLSAGATSLTIQILDGKDVDWIKVTTDALKGGLVSAIAGPLVGKLGELFGKYGYAELARQFTDGAGHQLLKTVGFKTILTKTLNAMEGFEGTRGAFMEALTGGLAKHLNVAD